jgi:L-cystine uptake protein TcyP (sodium:dicarboxylate symporter family)
MQFSAKPAFAGAAGVGAAVGASVGVGAGAPGCAVKVQPVLLVRMMAARAAIKMRFIFFLQTIKYPPLLLASSSKQLRKTPSCGACWPGTHTGA